jgi:hypothetical protein
MEKIPLLPSVLCCPAVFMSKECFYVSEEDLNSSIACTTISRERTHGLVCELTRKQSHATRSDGFDDFVWAQRLADHEESSAPTTGSIKQKTILIAAPGYTVPHDEGTV